jgi:nitrite reductase (NADH) small subunit
VTELQEGHLRASSLQEGGLPATTWREVCPVERLLPGRGAAALFGDVQVAVFRTADGAVHALGNVDPFSGAAVLSRGIVGDRGGVPIVASPVYKQAFSLVDGRCLDDPAVSVPAYPSRVADGSVQVGLPW